MTVGCVTHQQELNPTTARTCLCLPDRQGGSSERSKHVAAPRHPDGDDGAVHVILDCCFDCCCRFACVFRVHTFRLFRPAPLIWPRMLKAIVRHTRLRDLGVLGGRENGGRGDGPIRHGAQLTMDGCICTDPSHLTAGWCRSRKLMRGMYLAMSSRGTHAC